MQAIAESIEFIERGREIGVPESYEIGLAFRRREHTETNGFRLALVVLEGDEVNFFGVRLLQAGQYFVGIVFASIVHKKQFNPLRAIEKGFNRLNIESSGLIKARNDENRFSHGTRRAMFSPLSASHGRF